jgi:hypothetical protein
MQSLTWQGMQGPAKGMRERIDGLEMMTEYLMASLSQSFVKPRLQVEVLGRTMEEISDYSFRKRHDSEERFWPKLHHERTQFISDYFRAISWGCFSSHPCPTVTVTVTVSKCLF